MEAAAPVVANPEPARIGTTIAPAAEANPTTTDSSRKIGTRMGINPVAAAAEIRVREDVLIRVTEETNRSIGISDSKDRDKGGSTEIVPGVPEVRDKMGNAVSFREGTNRSIGTSKARRNDLGRKRVREIDNEEIRTDHNMAKKEASRIASTETREEVVASDRHLTKTRRMAAALEESGTTSHVVRMNITTKNRDKIWTTSSRRSRRS